MLKDVSRDDFVLYREEIYTVTFVEEDGVWLKSEYFAGRRPIKATFDEIDSPPFEAVEQYQKHIVSKRQCNQDSRPCLMESSLQEVVMHGAFEPVARPRRTFYDDYYTWVPSATPSDTVVDVDCTWTVAEEEDDEPIL